MIQAQHLQSGFLAVDGDQEDVIRKRNSAVQLERNGIACRFENDIFYVLCDHHDSYDSLAEKICSDLKSLSTSIRFSVSSPRTCPSGAS